jgi:hypothetical protein
VIQGLNTSSVGGVKSRGASHVESSGEVRNEYTILVYKCEIPKLLCRLSRT